LDYLLSLGRWPAAEVSLLLFLPLQLLASKTKAAAAVLLSTFVVIVMAQLAASCQSISVDLAFEVVQALRADLPLETKLLLV
jgi:hypothetical protein